MSYGMNSRRRVMPWLVALLVGVSFFVAFAHAGAQPVKAVAAAPVPTMSPDDLLAAVRNRFRAHRPPPPFEAYVIVRKQETNYGYPDYANSYTDHVWYRSYDHAALERRETELGDVGQMRFERPVF